MSYNTTRSAARLLIAAAGLTVCGLAVSACSPSPNGESGSVATKITVLDYFTDEASSEAWQKALATCEQETGVAIDRESLPLKEINTRVLQGASTRTLPALAFVDNVMVKQLANTGALTPVTDYGLSTEGVVQAMVDAATFDGEVYGLSTSANTIALYYNSEMLQSAGIEPPTTWSELQTAAENLTSGDRRGIAFSAPASEEATWQYLPFLWSAGGELTDVASPGAIDALEFLTNLVDSGVASASVVNWTQNDVSDQFIAGNTAMMINGPWSNAKLDAAGVPYAVVPIPVPETAGELIASIGGEIGVIPASGDATQLAAAEVLGCLMSDDVMLERNLADSRIPSRTSVADQLAIANPAMATFVDSIQNARARTTDLGENYPEASQAIWVAIQSAITGASSPEQALQGAQEVVEALG